MTRERVQIRKTLIGDSVDGVQKAIKAYIAYHKSYGRNGFRGYILHVDPIEIESTDDPNIKFEKYVLMSGSIFVVAPATRFSQKTIDSFDEKTVLADMRVVGDVINDWVESYTKDGVPKETK